MPKKWFRISFAEKAFLRFLDEAGLSVADLDVPTGVAAMTDFYENHGAQHTANGGEDTLHSSWDSGEVPTEFSVTRRMFRSDGDGTGRALTLRFSFVDSVLTAVRLEFAEI